MPSCYALTSILFVGELVTPVFSTPRPVVFIWWPLVGPEFEAETYGVLQESPRVCFVFYRDVLLLDRLDAFPSAAEPLLPQTDPVVAGADCERIAAQTPAYAPCGSVDVKLGALPLA